MAEQIEHIALHETTRERYLNYALSVITSRALPDIRDGLKPVQRRILYAMYHNLRLTHDNRFRKSAAVVGEVMAKYHPHGDQAIYDAMVRMAQSFSLRYPLVEGQGNFGSLDGDGAAAMRYTEARLQPMTSEIVEEIRSKTVEMRANYDGQFFEPVVLPAQLPNLLVNGATGIAVGMATNIPPHNLREVVKALVKLIDKPLTPLDEILNIIKGPDFPTGGKILETPKDLLKIYTKGRGSVTIAAEYTHEVTEDGSSLLVITSLPYGSNKATVVEKIAEHIRDNQIPQILDIRDESTDTIRIVCELAKKANPDFAMAYLYKHTPLQNRFHVNLTCLLPIASPPSKVNPHPTPGSETTVPAQVGLMQMLRSFLDFRLAVTTRRLQHQLTKLETRILILKAFATIFEHLDEVLDIIRNSDGRKDSADTLIARFKLTEEQTNAILDTKLFKLAKLEIKSILDELAEKESAAAELRTLLNDEAKRWDLIRSELKTLSRKYGDKRRSLLGDPSAEVPEYSEENYIIREDTFVIITREGWIKRQRSYSDISTIRVRDNDSVGWVFPTSTQHTIILITDCGQAYTIRADQIASTTGYGEPIQAHFSLADGERVIGASCTDPRCNVQIPGNLDLPLPKKVKPPPYLIAITTSGNAMRIPRILFEEPSNATGRRFMKLLEAAPDSSQDRVLFAAPCAGDEMVCIASTKRGVAFSVQEISLLRGPGRGVSAINLQGDDIVINAAITTDKYKGCTVIKPRGTEENVSPSRYAVARRNNVGKHIIRRGKLTAPTPEPVEVREIDDTPTPGHRLVPPPPGDEQQALFVPSDS